MDGCWMDGWVDGQRTDAWMDGWIMDEWIDGWIDSQISFCRTFCLVMANKSSVSRKVKSHSRMTEVKKEQHFDKKNFVLLKLL